MAAAWNWQELMTKITYAVRQAGGQIHVSPIRHPDYRLISIGATVIVVHREGDGQWSWADVEGRAGDGGLQEIPWHLARIIAPSAHGEQGQTKCAAAGWVFAGILAILLIITVVVWLAI